MTEKPEPIPDDLLPLSAACKLAPSPTAGKTHVHRSTLLEWIRRGELRGYRRGHFWFVSKAELLALYQRWEREPDLPRPQRPRLPDVRPSPAWVDEVLNRRRGR